MTHEVPIQMPEPVLALAQLAHEGFENPEAVIGSVQLSVMADGKPYPIAITFGPTEVDIRFESLVCPDATLTMPLATAKLIVDTITVVDYRDPDVIGSINFTGNLDLVNHVAKALLRPSDDTRERFELAERLDTDAYALTEIPRVSNPPELEILEALAAGRPMIITDLDVAVPHWQWSLERLTADYGEVDLRVRSAEHRETVAEFIARVRDAENSTNAIIEGHTKAYTEGCSLPEPMHQDFTPPHFTLDDYIEPQIWLGSVPVNVPASSLHHDPLDGFLYQVMGRKKVLMYAPDQAPYLYPMKAYNNYQPCWVKPEAPDYNRFPKFADARAIDVVLHPGELLIQPAGWFHAVYCLDTPTFSVSHFFRH